jgi:spermidine/putrescine transport system ATP-binding protein
MAANIIELQSVSKLIQQQVILHNINLSVHHGEFLTLLGPSGCGKTTLLRLISGFIEPSQGKIFINDKDMSRLPPHLRQVHTVFQNYALFPHMTVFDNIAFGLRCQKTASAEIASRVAAVLELVKLSDLAQRKPEQLSGGQQQRVAIARAIVNKPLVLLLDEPLSSLDYRLRKNMQIELKQLQRQLGITFILVTHDQEEALSMSDRIVVMEQGRIAQIGTPREVYEEPRNLTVAKFVGEANIFNAEVVEINHETITVLVCGKQRHIVSQKPCVLGQKVYLLIRPEDCRVWHLSEIQHNTTELLLGIVTEVIYKGSTVDLLVKIKNSDYCIAATEFFDEDDATLEYVIGEEVWVTWPAGWEVLLIDETN